MNNIVPEFLDDQILSWFGKMERAAAESTAKIHNSTLDEAIEIQRELSAILSYTLNKNRFSLEKVPNSIHFARKALVDEINNLSAVRHEQVEKLCNCFVKYLDALRLVREERRGRCSALLKLSDIMPAITDWGFTCEILELMAISQYGFEFIKLGNGGASPVIEEIDVLIAQKISFSGLMIDFLQNFAVTYEEDLNEDIKEMGFARNKPVRKILQRIQEAKGRPVALVFGKEFWEPFVRAEWRNVEKIDCNTDDDRLRDLVRNPQANKGRHYLLINFEILDTGTQHFLLENCPVTCCFNDREAFQEIDGGTFSRLHSSINLSDLYEMRNSVFEGVPLHEELEGTLTQIRTGKYGGYTDLLVSALLRTIAGRDANARGEAHAG